MKQKTLTIIAPFQYGKENSRAIAHGIKAGDETAIEEAARVLVTCIQGSVTLVPIPNSTGVANTTLKLANKIASLRPDITVKDIIVGRERPRAFDVKKSGKAVDRTDYEYRTTAAVPANAVLLDNCIDTAHTAAEAMRATGISTLLTYAVTTKKKVIPTKWIHTSSEAAYYKTGYKVVWLKAGDYYSPLCGDLLPFKRWLKAKDIEPYDQKEVDKQTKYIPSFLRHYHIKVGGPRRWFKNETSIAYRPGFHLYQLPKCTQFNTIVKGKRTKRLAPGLYWAEVLYCNEQSYQQQSDARTFHSARGRCKDYSNYNMGGLNHMPHEGFYTYRDQNSDDANTCICTDRIYILRILNEQDIKNILSQS